MLFLWIYDYHIFTVVTIIKIISAVGMMLGLLYFMYFNKLDLPLAALGIWVYGNGLYIVASVILGIYHLQIAGTSSYITAAASVILGTRNSFTDALFAMAFIGLTGTVFASVLTWKSISTSLHFLTFSASPRASGITNPPVKPPPVKPPKGGK